MHDHHGSHHGDHFSLKVARDFWVTALSSMGAEAAPAAHDGSDSDSDSEAATQRLVSWNRSRAGIEAAEAAKRQLAEEQQLEQEAAEAIRGALTEARALNGSGKGRAGKRVAADGAGAPSPKKLAASAEHDSAADYDDSMSLAAVSRNRGRGRGGCRGLGKKIVLGDATTDGKQAAGDSDDEPLSAVARKRFLPKGPKMPTP